MSTPTQRGPTNLGVINPAILRVFDANLGREIHTDELLGADEASVMRLRFRAQSFATTTAKHGCTSDRTTDRCEVFADSTADLVPQNAANQATNDCASNIGF